MLLADPPPIESPEKTDTFTETPFSIFLSLDDDEENIGFDQLEDLDDEDGFDDDLDEEDEFEDEDEEEEEEEDDEDFGDEEDDEFEDEGFDDDDDF